MAHPATTPAPEAPPGPYVAAGYYLVRAPVLPAGVFAELTAVAGWERARQHTLEVLRRWAEDPVLRQALTVASDDLAHGLQRVQRGNGDTRRVERAYATLFRYLTRMSTRPTPFGLFAAVGFGTLGAATSLRLGDPPVRRIRARPDVGWLVSVIKLVEQQPDLVQDLEVLANHLVYDTGAHAVLPQSDLDRENDERAVVLRAGRAVRCALAEARQPIAYQTLRDRLQQAFPDAGTARVDGMLRELFGHHVLVSNLRPPLTDPDPAGHVLHRLRRVPGAATVCRRLAAVVDGMREVDRAGVGAGAGQIGELVASQRALADVAHQTMQVDAALEVRAPELNLRVGEALADAADTLLRLTPDPGDSPHLREYCVAFVERYGSGTEVPVQELLSPERGLDAPPTYMFPRRAHPLATTLPPPQPGERDELLGTVLAEALRSGAQRVELDDELLDRLSPPRPAGQGSPARPVDMIVQVAAPSREALDRGEWQGLAAPTTGGRMFGRFVDLLGAEALAALRATARHEEELLPDVIFAELSYFPAGRRANVALRPLLRDYEIVVNTAPSLPRERVLGLDDLVVGAHDGHFYVRSLCRGRQVVATQSHMLNLRLAPNVCRFLLEASVDGRPQPAPFDWGMVRNAPFLPRVARGNVVLSPAQWNLRPALLGTGSVAGGDERLHAALRRWREDWQVPRHVYLVEDDARLLLDLEHPFSVAQLRRQLDKTAKAAGAGPVQLQEPLPGLEQLWLRDGKGRGYFSELVVPLLPRPMATPARPAREGRPTPAPAGPVPDDTRQMLPGGAWTYLKLYAPGRLHEELIAGPVREVARLLRARGLVDHWFFIRYADPDPHLRVRFHAGGDAARDAVLTEATAWGRTLAEQGLINRMVLDSYVREVERYGGPDAIAALEEAFGIDSELVGDLLAAMRSGRLGLDPTLIAGFTLDRLATCFGLDLTGRLQFAAGVAEGDAEPVAALQARRLLLCDLLADPDARRGSLTAEQAAQAERLADLWAAHGPALRPVAARVKELAEHGKLWQPEEGILASLAHLHVNRLVGINHERERTIYALWRYSLESLRRRGMAVLARG